jgi:hypothetical protein
MPALSVMVGNICGFMFSNYTLSDFSKGAISRMFEILASGIELNLAQEPISSFRIEDCETAI